MCGRYMLSTPDGAGRRVPYSRAVTGLTTELQRGAEWGSGGHRGRLWRGASAGAAAVRFDPCRAAEKPSFRKPSLKAAAWYRRTGLSRMKVRRKVMVCPTCIS